MASAWGASFGSAWGNSWGEIATAESARLGLIGEKRKKKKRDEIPLGQILYEIDRQKAEQDRKAREKARAELNAIAKATAEAKAALAFRVEQQKALIALEAERIAELEAIRMDEDKRRRLLLLAAEADYFH